MLFSIIITMSYMIRRYLIDIQSNWVLYLTPWSTLPIVCSPLLPLAGKPAVLGVIEMSSDKTQRASYSWTVLIASHQPLRCLFSIQHIIHRFERGPMFYFSADPCSYLCWHNTTSVQLSESNPLPSVPRT